MEIPFRLLDRILAVWHPEEIRLFGSRARGTAGAASDWDLLVVVPDDTPEHLLDLGAARKVIRDLRIPADVVPVRRAEFEEGRQHFGSLSQIADTEGRIVYAV